MKEEGTKTPTEREGVRGKEGEGPAIEGPTVRKEQGAVYNTVQCCSAPLSGMEGRAGTMGFCPRGEGQQLQRTPSFQPICLWPANRMLLLPWPHAQHLHARGPPSLSVTTAALGRGDEVSLVTLWRYTRIQTGPREIKERKYFREA